MKASYFFAVSCVISIEASAQDFDAATAFGAREAVQDISLSPDGTKIAFISPGSGTASKLQTISLTEGDKMRTALSAAGNPERLGACEWVSNLRLVCSVFGTVDDGIKFNYLSRVIAVNFDGTGLKLLSNRQSPDARYLSYGGGEVIDFLPDQEGQVLMSRPYVPEGRLGTKISKTKEGLAVDQIDTSTLRTKSVIEPVENASRYLSDGLGHVRIMALADFRVGYETGVTKYRYRRSDKEDWQPLSEFDSTTDTGFQPVAIDAADNSVLGFEKHNSRAAVYRVKLDGSATKTMVFSHDQVDVDRIVSIGRNHRPIGVSYAVRAREVHYFDPKIASLRKGLAKALPGQAVAILDASADEQKLLISASSDRNPGEYFLLDRTIGQMRPLMLARPELEKAKLSEVRAVEVTARDGTRIPAYLTLPEGKTGNLPAIVMPHGGPSARDEWGFDWLPQFFAAQGYAVLQPNYRGSAGYGDEWYVNNGFQSWSTAIGDITDSGRWMVEQGLADPKRVAIFGWSYGGYAALQAGAVAPDFFKAIIAVAPVTDLQLYRDSAAGYTHAKIVREFVGSGFNLKDGSPAEQASKITSPVMIFHGVKDVNVSVEHSRLMARRLKEAGRPADYVEIPDLDHYLEDGATRRDLLAKSAGFLTKAFSR